MFYRILILSIAVFSLCLAAEPPKEPDWDLRYRQLYQEFYKTHTPPKIGHVVQIELNMLSTIGKSAKGPLLAIQAAEKAVVLQQPEDQTLTVPRKIMSIDDRQRFFPRDYAHYKAYAQVQDEKAEWPAKLAAWREQERQRQAVEQKRVEIQRRVDAENRRLEAARQRRQEAARRAERANNTKQGEILQVVNDSILLFIPKVRNPRYDFWESQEIIAIGTTTDDYFDGDWLKVYLKEVGVFRYETVGGSKKKVRRYIIKELLEHRKPGDRPTD